MRWPHCIVIVLVLLTMPVAPSSADPIRHASSARASTLDFEELLSSDVSVVRLQEYRGFEWDNVLVFDAERNGLGGTGYDMGTVSGDAVAWNQLGELVAISGPTFNFNSAYFTAAWRTDLDLLIRAFAGDQQRFMAQVTIGPFAPTLFAPHWRGIDRLQFVGAGGTTAFPGHDGTQVAFDNFTFSTTPEPNLIIPVGTAAVGLFVARRRRVQA
jgi:hypothetical protein